MVSLFMQTIEAVRSETLYAVLFLQFTTQYRVAQPILAASLRRQSKITKNRVPDSANVEHKILRYIYLFAVNNH